MNITHVTYVVKIFFLNVMGMQQKISKWSALCHMDCNENRDYVKDAYRTLTIYCNSNMNRSSKKMFKFVKIICKESPYRMSNK